MKYRPKRVRQLPESRVEPPDGIRDLTAKFGRILLGEKVMSEHGETMRPPRTDEQLLKTKIEGKKAAIDGKVDYLRNFFTTKPQERTDQFTSAIEGAKTDIRETLGRLRDIASPEQYQAALRSIALRAKGGLLPSNPVFVEMTEFLKTLGIDEQTAAKVVEIDYTQPNEIEQGEDDGS